MKTDNIFMVCMLVVLLTTSLQQLSVAQTSQVDWIDKLESSNDSERKMLTSLLVNQMTISEKQKKASLDNDGINPKKELIDLSPMLSSQDFLPESRTILENEYIKEKSKQNMLLAGMARVYSVESDIIEYAARQIEPPAVGKFYGTLSWAGNLVMARRGDKNSLRKVLSASQQADIHSRIIFLIKELAYLPQPEVAEYIADFVFSENRLESVKPTVAGLLHAQYAAAALSRMLSGCPVPYKEDYSYTDHEINMLRNWLTAKKLNKQWGFRSNGQ